MEDVAEVARDVETLAYEGGSGGEDKPVNAERVPVGGEDVEVGVLLVVVERWRREVVPDLLGRYFDLSCGHNLEAMEGNL